MSFIYAKKEYLKECKLNSVQILSDTKIDTMSLNNSKTSKTYKTINTYGIIKSLIICPSCCISFAGNNIDKATKLIDSLIENKEFSIDSLMEEAFEIHNTSENINDIEFIICYSDEKNEVHINCIKNGEIEKDVYLAWIGTYAALKSLQEEVSKGLNTFSAFQNVVLGGKIDCVGGLINSVTYNYDQKSFKYQEYTLTAVYREKLYKSNDIIEIVGSKEEGAFQMHMFENMGEVYYEFPQIDRIILFTKMRYEDDDKKFPHFLLPILLEASTSKVL